MPASMWVNLWWLSDEHRDTAGDIRKGADPMAAGRRFIRGEPSPTQVNDPELQSSYETYNR
jgi:hypothetical protein